MNNNFREYYKALYFSNMNFSPHSYGYSGKLAGAMYAVGEIRDAVPIIHGSAGCGFHYKYICRRGYLPAYNAQCTNLEEKDIIFGGADKLRKTILETDAKLSPAMITVIPSTSVDMIQDEIENVINSLKDKVKCKLIWVKSEKFSHADKRDKRAFMKQSAANWNNDEFINELNFKGCGFVEAMKAMVDGVMERQEIQKKSVNICGLAWGAGGSAVVDGMVTELKDLNIAVNSYLPNCTTREIIEAPRAELNIVSRRVQWAERMKEVFGTQYFHMSSFNFYSGPDGIEKLYLKISERLHCKNEAAKILSAKKHQTLERLKDVKEYFNKNSFALITSNYRNASCLIEKYEKDFGISFKYVCVYMDKEDLEFDKVSDDVAQIFIKNMHEALQKNESKAQILINANYEILKEILKEVDFVIGGEELDSKPQGIRYIQDIDSCIPMDFAGFENSVKNFAERIEKTALHSNLLVDRFDYDQRYYPMLKNNNMKGSMKMWEKMWIQREW